MPRQGHNDKPENHICENCREHQATNWWAGEGGPLALSRFYMQAAWCECCMLKSQIEYAEKRAADLENLREKLAAVKCEVAVTPTIQNGGIEGE